MTAAEEQKEEVRKDDTDRKMPTPSFSSGDASGQSTTSGLGSVPASAASPASSVSSTRPPYIPQFSAATELILKRLKGEPTSLSAVLSQAARSVPVTTTFSTIKSEDTKNRVSTSFTASTQMTLQMPATAPPARPAPSPSSVLPSPAAPAAPAPPAPSLPASKPFTGMSAIRKVTAGLTASSKPAASKPPPPPPEPKAKKVKQTTKGHLGKRKRIKAEDSDSESSPSPSSSSQRSTPAAVSPAPAGAATPTSLTATPTSAPVLLTMTKSGRQVLKPASYDPAAIDAASRRHRANHHQSNSALKGPRTVEQALCRRCSRLHSPANNQMVFCDGCNDAWHQMCHEPRITNEVRDAARGWFCAACTTKKAASNNNNSSSSSGGDKNQVTKSSITINTTNGAPGSTTLASTSSVRPRTKLPSQPQPRQPERTSWASRPVQAKRAYLSTLSQQELVSLLMSCLEIHPDLPIFPPAPGGSVASPATSTTPTSTNLPDHHHHHGHGHGHGPRSLFAGTSTEGLFPRASSASESFKKGAVTNGKAAASSINGGKTSRNHKEDSVHEDQNGGGEADEEADPLAALWPRVGEGMYARLPPDVEDDERLVDEGDYEAFSVIVYDERGRKVEENGMKV